MKYRNNPSLDTIKRHFKHIASFYLTVLKEPKNLQTNEAVQDTDVPVKILKNNGNFISE